MSGHSKWSTIKHKKAVEDNKRGKIFTKLGKAISIAARDGNSGDTSSNFKLRLAIDKAKQFNMPKKNIERAVERGLGQGGGEALSEALYEGYGPYKTAVMVEVVTDNKNRTSADIKKIFDRGGGSLGQPGSVGFMFKRIGVLEVLKKTDSESQILEIMDMGVDDVNEEAEGVLVKVAPSELGKVRQQLDLKGYKVKEAQLVYKALNYLELDEEKKRKVMEFLNELDELDDVQEIYINID